MLPLTGWWAFIGLSEKARHTSISRRDSPCLNPKTVAPVHHCRAARQPAQPGHAARAPSPRRLPQPQPDGLQHLFPEFRLIGTDAVATLPADWKVDKLSSSQTVGTYATAGTTTNRLAGDNMSCSASNGIYNFGAGDPATATDRAVGFLSSSSATYSGNLYALFNNGTGSAPLLPDHLVQRGKIPHGHQCRGLQRPVVLFIGWFHLDFRRSRTFSPVSRRTTKPRLCHCPR